MPSLRAMTSSGRKASSWDKKRSESKAMVVGSSKGSWSRGRSRKGDEMVSQWMQQASEVQRQEIEEAFKFFDDNKDGKITEAELAAALERLGENPTEEQVKEMFREADTNRDGVISYEEFVALQSRMGGIYREEGAFLEDVRRAFVRFDADRNGLISPEELQGVLARLGRPSSLPDCRRMISRVDLDGDGHINFHEFLSMMKE